MDAEKIVFINGNDDEIAKAKALGVTDDKLPKYVPGCIKNGISKEIAEEIWAQMADFAKYAFNKSHAAAYAAISMETAVLKALYPVEFMCGLLTSVMDAPKKYVKYIAEAKKMGIKILPFDINKCVEEFSIENNSLRPGLISVVGLGENIAKTIVERRESGYKGLTDFVERVPEADKTVLTNLVFAGAFDFTGSTRRTMANAVEILKKNKKNKQIEGQMSLFDVFEDAAKDDFFNYPEYSMDEFLRNEKASTNIYISGHPLDPYNGYIEKHIKDFAADLDEERKDDKTEMMVFINSVKVIYTKSSGRKMAFVSAEDQTGNIEIVVFPDTYEKYGKLLKEDKAILVRGKISVRETENAQENNEESEDNSNSGNIEISVLASEVISADNLPGSVWVRVPSAAALKEFSEAFADFLNTHEGNDTLKLYFDTEKVVKQWDFKTGKNDIPVLTNIFGQENVKYQY